MGKPAQAAADLNVHGYAHVSKRLGVHPYVRFRRPAPAAQSAQKDNSWSVPDLCAAYDWPNRLPGGGVMAIVELGGGWIQSDMDSFFQAIDQPVPTILDVSVDATRNTPDPGPRSSDGEVALDIQVAGAAYFAATGHPATIRVYWSRDIAAAVRAATADGCDVCCISWGSDEAHWRAGGGQAGEDMELAAAQAVAAGMVVFAATGDNDSSDGGPTRANVDLPASCPHVIGCGGTSKTKATETVWNNSPGNADGLGTGGGFSTMFPMPGWQAGAPHGPGRMAPDVAANADPDTGYQIFFHGAQAVVGGTSAVASLYAGLFAAFGTKLGFVTPELWTNHLCFNDITAGDNGAYRARIGPDPCTGLGSPNGRKLSELLAHHAATAERWLREGAVRNRELSHAIAGMRAAAVAAPAEPVGCCQIAGSNGYSRSYPGLTQEACDRMAALVPGGVGRVFPGACTE